MGLTEIYISILLDLISVVLITSSLFMMRKRESVLHSISKGLVCVDCKLDIPISDRLMDPIRLYDELTDGEDYTTKCINCKRDSSIDTILKKKSVIVVFFNKLIYSKSLKISITSIFLMTIFLNLISIFFPKYHLGLISSIELLMACIFTIVRNFKTSRPKS